MILGYYDLDFGAFFYLGFRCIVQRLVRAFVLDSLLFPRRSLGLLEHRWRNLLLALPGNYISYISAFSIAAWRARAGHKLSVLVFVLSIRRLYGVYFLYTGYGVMFFYLLST